MTHLSRPRPQRTIGRSVAVSGRGYWSGTPVRVAFEPAAADAGVVFVRSDLGAVAVIPARIGHRVEATQRTVLAAGPAEVQMVEHVLSALAALCIDNCRVIVDAAELPGLDGSAAAFVAALDEAGSVDSGATVAPLVVGEPVRVESEAGWIEAGPPRHGHDGLSIDYELDYGPGPIGRQRLEILVTSDSYRRELAGARTFLGIDEARRLQASGLGRAVSTSDLVIFGPDGPVDNALRWPDECVRHKVLDAVGDLALAGRPIVGHIRAHRSGHRLNAALVETLLATVAPPAAA
ncbi:MAG: UDP-3-O-[3-hydroxymyristoyl] N-acetylglucosamine deacetylase [Planctomycetes bacterium]|nr:UDP-3-O-[3-hydroxymyristoyl] N-acetylglucosamine deacetylase [Planctomycetota bacterium]